MRGSGIAERMVNSRKRLFSSAELADRAELCMSPVLLPGRMIPREVIFTVGTVDRASQDIIPSLAKPILV